MQEKRVGTVSFIYSASMKHAASEQKRCTQCCELNGAADVIPADNNSDLLWRKHTAFCPVLLFHTVTQ